MSSRGNKKSIKVTIAFILLGFGLLQYQSCAPANENFDQDQELSTPVSGIDVINVGQISFPQSKVSAFMNQQLNVIGLCEQSDSLIGWKLKTPDNQLIERGLAKCELGSFEVQLSDSWESLCGVPLKLEAALGTEAQSEIIVEGSCQ